MRYRPTAIAAIGVVLLVVAAAIVWLGSRSPIDEAALVRFPAGSILYEQEVDGTPPRDCADEGKNGVFHIELASSDRPHIWYEPMTTEGRSLRKMALGVSGEVHEKNDHWTVFSAKSEGRYLILMVGVARGRDDDDVSGAQRRLQLFFAHQNVIALVEDVPVDAPAFERPRVDKLYVQAFMIICPERFGTGRSLLD